MVRVAPEGVVMVLDLVIVPPPLVMVEDLLIPAGLERVLDIVVLVFEADVLLRMAPGGVAVGGVVAAGVVWAVAAVPPSRASETRKPRMRFIKNGTGVSKKRPNAAAPAAVM